MTPFDDAADTDTAATLGERLMATVCGVIGEPMRDRWTVGELSALLALAGYTDCDPDALFHLAQLGRVTPPPADGWDAGGAAQVVCYLNACRCWQPAHPVHDRHKTPARLEREKMEAAGVPLVLPQKGLLFWLWALAQEHDPAAREAIAEGLFCHLTALGVDLHG